MATAAFVLAIIADVLAVPAALGAIAFGSFLASNTGGFLGGEALGGGLLAIIAAAGGIAGTTVLRGRPVLGAVLVVAAAIAGSVGTLAFIPATALYAVAAILALLAARKPASAAAVATPTPTVEATPAAPSGSPRSAAGSLGWRDGRAALGVGVVVLVVASLGLATLVRADDEVAAARALFAAVEVHDDVALAQLLPESSRTSDIAGDASRALSAAFEGSGLAVLSTEWTGRIAQASGAEVRFEGLTFSSVEKGDRSARVRATGTFAPRHENVLINAGLGLLRRPFQVDVSLIRTDAGWRLDAPPAAVSPEALPSATRAAASGPTRVPSAVRPSLTPAPAPTPTATPAPVATAAPFEASWVAEFSDPAATGLLPAGVEDHDYTLRYQGGHAILAGCRRDLVSIERLPCYWGVTRPEPGFTAITATGESQAEWGLAFRVSGPARWTARRAPDSVLLASVDPSRGHYRLRIGERDGRMRFTSIAGGESPAVRRGAPNTLELRLEGAQVVFLVNGTELLRRPDPQGEVGLGFGVFVDPGLEDRASLDVSHFAGR